MIVDVVMLSKCTDEDSFALNNRSIESLLNSESDIFFNIFLIEDNRDFSKLGFCYPYSNITVICPGTPFNFNHFLNVGLLNSKEQWIVFSNNDVIFHKNWLSEIYKVRSENEQIQSFCPFDRTSPFLKLEGYNHKPYYIGYRVPIEFVGWCFITERSIFDKIGKFDETFDMYFQDNDFALTLKKNSILHAMVPASFVEHLGGYTTKVSDASITPKYAADKDKFLKKWKKPLWKKIISKVFKSSDL